MVLGWSRIGGTAGAWVSFEVRPGMSVNQSIRLTFHIPVWYWRHVTGHYFTWFGRLYARTDH